MRYRYKLVRVLFNDSVTSAPDPAEDAEYVEALACFLSLPPENPTMDDWKSMARALLRSPLMRGQ
jgi:hypothetical protein